MQNCRDQTTSHPSKTHLKKKTENFIIPVSTSQTTQANYKLKHKTTHFNGHEQQRLHGILLLFIMTSFNTNFSCFLFTFENFPDFRFKILGNNVGIWP